MRIAERLVGMLGGSARTRVVVLLGCVLALENADLATIGAAAPQLQDAFHISGAQLGLLAAISTFVGAVATVPAGVLTDRVRRVRLLAMSIALWAIAMGACALARDYGSLLLARVGLGAVSATAGPAIASLTGDFFPPAERGKVYGFILSGELIGAGVGFVLSGSVAGAVSWRAAFAVLIVPAAALAIVLWRRLPEPARGGASRLEPGARRILDAEAAGSRAARPGVAEPDQSAGVAEPDQSAGVARRAVERRDIDAVPDRVLDRDPRAMRLPQAVRYVLRIPTNRWLIVAAAFGYLFFAGMRTFALVFIRGHLGLGQAAATAVLFLAGLGTLVGVLASGRLADRLIGHGRLDARVLVGAISYLAAPVLLAPALLFGAPAVVVPFLFLGALALAAPNPPLDAARLDVMPAHLWGRAEGVRTLLRQSAQAAAPLLFGLIADALGATSGSASQQHVTPGTTDALRDTFLIMLVPLAVNGVMLLVARRHYPADVATAIASERALTSGGIEPPPRPRPQPRLPRRREEGSAASRARTAG